MQEKNESHWIGNSAATAKKNAKRAIVVLEKKLGELGGGNDG